MRWPLTAGAFLLFLFLCVATLTAQTASGVIDGNVIDDAGSPVPMAAVSLMNETGRVLKTVEADVRGMFVFDALAEGRYTVSASKLGYVTRAYGQTTPDAGNVIVALSQNGRHRARVRVPRVGALSGSVLDEHAQPVSAEVRLQRFVMRGGLRVLDEATTKKAEADRFGRYRFADLPPGEYVVSAIGPDGELRRPSADLIQRAEQAVQQRGQPLPLFLKDTGSESTVSYLAVYYPGVLNRARATAVPIVSGEERPDINLQLQLTPTVRLQGTVLTADGKPVAYTTVKLVSPDDGSTWSYGQTTSAGVFQLAPVPQGPYAVLTGNARVDLSLADPAPSGLTVRTDTGGSVTGRVQFSGSTPKPDCRSTPCTPVLFSRGQSSAWPGSSDVRGIMDEGGPIVFSTVPPGSYTVGLNVAMTGWTLVSAMLDGRDLTDTPLEVGPRQDYSGLVVTFTDRSASLSGKAPVGGTAPTADTITVVAFSTDRRFWIPGGRRVRVVRPDTSGQYRIAGLPAGEYFVAVVTNFDAETELDTTRLAALEASATRVTVREPEPR